jgi:hypothetical protein
MKGDRAFGGSPEPERGGSLGRVAAQSSAEPPLPRQESSGFKLDLKGVSAAAAADIAEGDQKKDAVDTLTTPRAANENEPALTVRGAAKARAKLLCALTPETLGASRCKTAWRPGGAMLAIASEKDGGLLMQTFKKDGKPSESHNLGPGRPTWCEWDSSGHSVAVMQEGVGLYLWDVAGATTPADTPPSQPLRLCPSITVAASFCMWSKKHPQLAIGTQAGKVIVFNKAEGVMQLHDKKGKHGAAVTRGGGVARRRPPRV